MAAAVDFFDVPTSLKFECLAKGFLFEKGPGPQEDKDAKGQKAAERVVVTVNHPDEATFGDLVRIQSAYKTDRVWTDIAALDASMVDKFVWIRARLSTNRQKGKSVFWVLRRGFSTVQCAAFAGNGPNEPTKEFVTYCGKVTDESVVDIYGKVVKADVGGCTQKDVEISMIKMFVVSAAAGILPFKLEDASRYIPEDVEQKIASAKAEDETAAAARAASGKKEDKKAAKKEEDQLISVGIDLRLNNRVIDLRTPANHAIFKMQSRVGQYFREYFLDLDFVEIHSPKITPGVSEGGAEVFHLKYFGRKACLAQSPQLFKQMAVIGDLYKVFEIGPVFRAENSNTNRHLCEFMGMDFEMEIKEHYHELLQVLGNCFVFIFEQLNKYCQKEMAAINVQHPFQPLRFRPKDQTLILSHKEACEMLAAVGENVVIDFTTPQEKRLGKLIAEKYNTDFYIVDKYPQAARPFYTMPSVTDPGCTNSYDVFVRGEEITSGAQRIHDVELLKVRAAECGIPLSSIAAYLDSFKFGAFPHGGAGVGLERVVMLFMGLPNIRKASMFPRDPKRLSP
jgi:aspartyl-tRNA synthetase